MGQESHLKAWRGTSGAGIYTLGEKEKTAKKVFFKAYFGLSQSLHINHIWGKKKSRP